KCFDHRKERRIIDHIKTTLNHSTLYIYGSVQRSKHYYFTVCTEQGEVLYSFNQVIHS
nr:RecName: Full=Stress response protein; AltName: Full=Basic protein [Nicotiana sylvestris]